MASIAPARERVVLGVVLVLAASTAFGAVPVVGRLAFDHGAGTLTLLAGRYVLATAALALVLLLVPRTRPTGGGLPLGMLLMAAAANAAANIGYLGAVALDDVTRVAPLVFLYPVLVPLAAAVLGRESLRRLTLAAAAVGVTGTVLVVGGGGLAAPRDSAAAALALLAAVANVAFVLTAAEAVRRTGWVPVATVMFALCAGTFGVVAVATGSATPDATGWAFVAVFGVLCTAAPFGLWLVGVRLAGVSRTAALAVWEPAVAVLLALAVLGEALEPVQAIGIGLVLGSLALVGAGVQADRPPGTLSR